MAFTFRSQYDPDVAKTMRAFYQTLSERDRRRYVAVEAQRLGHGGINGNSLHCSLSRQHRVRPFLEILKLSCPLPSVTRQRRVRGTFKTNPRTCSRFRSRPTAALRRCRGSRASSDNAVRTSRLRKP